MKQKTQVLFGSLMLVLLLALSACGNDQPEVVDEPVVSEDVVDTEADVDAEVAVDAEADAEVDAEADAEAGANAEATAEELEAVETAVMTETETLVDTDVITEVAVMTETESAEIIVETTVMTDTEVSIDTETMTDTDVTVERDDAGSSGGMGIVIITDSAGNNVLGDPLNEQPYFAGEQGFAQDDNFEAVHADDEIIMGEGFDQELVGEQEENGVRQLTYNNYYLYRYVGPGDGDWRQLAQDFGVSPLTPEGEYGEYSD